jgi:hypothetical protein
VIVRSARIVVSQTPGQWIRPSELVTEPPRPANWTLTISEPGPADDEPARGAGAPGASAARVPCGVPEPVAVEPLPLGADDVTGGWPPVEVNCSASGFMAFQAASTSTRAPSPAAAPTSTGRRLRSVPCGFGA